MSEPGKRMGKSGYKMLDVMLNKEGIAKKVGHKITGFESNCIHFEDETFVESDLTMFIPASDGVLLLQNSDLPLNDAGFIYRKNEKDLFIPLPVIGHWLKILWGWNYKITRTLGL